MAAKKSTLLTFWILDLLAAVSLDWVAIFSKFQLYVVWDVPKRAWERWEASLIKNWKIISKFTFHNHAEVDHLGASARPLFCRSRRSPRWWQESETSFGILRTNAFKWYHVGLCGCHGWGAASKIMIKFSHIWKLSMLKFKNVRCPLEHVIGDRPLCLK